MHDARRPGARRLAGLPGLDGTRARSSCAWGTDPDASRPGIFGPTNLPEVVRRDYVMNANDSYWTPNASVRLEGFARIIGCEQCERTMRTQMVTKYVEDRLARHGGAGKESPRSLRRHEHENRLRAAEVMLAGNDLVEFCNATGETAACAVLAAWDGRSHADLGRDAHLRGAPQAETGRLAVAAEVPFDAADPFNTPRDLAETNADVQAAMKAAIAHLRSQGVPLDARWGSLQVTDGSGAPSPSRWAAAWAMRPGNANALASYTPVQNKDRFKPVTYGSSHIQAIIRHEPRARSRPGRS